MDRHVLFLTLVCVFSFSATILLTASIVSADWFENKTLVDTRTFGLWRSCTETAFGETCPNRKYILEFKKIFEDFDTALLLNILTLVFCVFSMFFVMAIMYHRKPPLWLSMLAVVNAFIGAALAIALVVFVELEIFDDLKDYSRSWALFTAYAGMASAILAAIFFWPIPCCFPYSHRRKNGKSSVHKGENMDDLSHRPSDVFNADVRSSSHKPSAVVDVNARRFSYKASSSVGEGGRSSMHVTSAPNAAEQRRSSRAPSTIVENDERRISHTPFAVVDANSRRYSHTSTVPDVNTRRYSHTPVVADVGERRYSHTPVVADVNPRRSSKVISTVVENDGRRSSRTPSTVADVNGRRFSYTHSVAVSGNPRRSSQSQATTVNTRVNAGRSTSLTPALADSNGRPGSKEILVVYHNNKPGISKSSNKERRASRLSQTNPSFVSDGNTQATRVQSVRDNRGSQVRNISVHGDRRASNYGY